MLVLLLREQDGRQRSPDVLEGGESLFVKVQGKQQETAWGYCRTLLLLFALTPYTLANSCSCLRFARSSSAGVMFVNKYRWVLNEKNF